jgi:hypothetical protein
MKFLFLFVFIAGSILESKVGRAQTGQPAQNEWKIVEAAKKEGRLSSPFPPAPS